MLRSLNEIVGYRVRATDGEMGKVEDFYFDDLDWVVRYLVMDTGHWLAGKGVAGGVDAGADRAQP